MKRGSAEARKVRVARRRPAFFSPRGATKMAIRNLVPWGRERGVSTPREREDPFTSLHREMNRMFEDFARSFDLAPWSGWGTEGFHPRIDVQETDDEVLVTAEMPGLEEKDFELNLTGDVLTLKGEKRHEHEEKAEGAIHRIERGYGSFQRAISLPCEVVAEKASADYRRGVLTVKLPKAPSAKRSVHRIDVKAG
jgi:HSP20 family protein